jgi:hypothetical protein
MVYLLGLNRFMESVEANQSLKIYLPLVRCGEVRLMVDSLEVLEEVYRGLFVGTSSSVKRNKPLRTKKGFITAAHHAASCLKIVKSPTKKGCASRKSKLRHLLTSRLSDFPVRFNR